MNLPRIRHLANHESKTVVFPGTNPDESHYSTILTTSENRTNRGGKFGEDEIILPTPDGVKKDFFQLFKNHQVSDMQEEATLQKIYGEFV